MVNRGGGQDEEYCCDLWSYGGRRSSGGRFRVGYRDDLTHGDSAVHCGLLCAGGEIDEMSVRCQLFISAFVLLGQVCVKRYK